MPTTISGNRASFIQLILVPGVITLAVTILRLVGELQHWSKLLFNPSYLGGGAPIGIAWLAPIFGIYFALKLAGAGERPRSVGKASELTVLGLVVMGGVGAVLGRVAFGYMGLYLGAHVLLVAAALIPLLGWPSLAKVLLAYGYAARIPVAIVMYFALRGNWGTHYDALHANFPAMSFWPKYVMAALLPQFILWIAFTVITGSLSGIIAVALFRREKATPQATP